MELSLLPLAFGPSLIVASRFLHPYSTEDKTPRLMVKQFSTARNKGLYREEKSKEGGRGDQEEKRESKKGREKSSQ